MIKKSNTKIINHKAFVKHKKIVGLSVDTQNKRYRYKRKIGKSYWIERFPFDTIQTYEDFEIMVEMCEEKYKKLTTPLKLKKKR
jgi:hypothetical protein